MRKRLRILLAGVLLASVVGAQGQSASLYRVDGDAQAAPIQAFIATSADAGDLLYVQLRNPATPPAPIGPNGPIPYVMRGPYMVLPPVAMVTLKYGPYTATVRALAAAHASPDVISVTQPVDALAPPPAPPRPPAAPRSGVVPVLTPLSAHGDDAQRVAGVISVRSPGHTPPRSPVATDAAQRPVIGPVRTVSHAAPTPVATAKPSRPRPAPDVPKVVPAKAKPAPKSKWVVGYKKAAESETWADQSEKGGLLLLADGTAEGVQAAITARAACRSAGGQCEIVYRGGRPGVLVVENTVGTVK